MNKRLRNTEIGLRNTQILFKSEAGNIYEKYSWQQTTNIIM
jgi:hypothetical protein